MRNPNAFAAACPSREVLARLGAKWASLIINKLNEGPVRFTDLLEQVEGISKKMLTQTLRDLERDGFVTRHLDASRMPVQVDYALTGLGRSAVPIVMTAKEWAEANFESVLEARQRYDSRKN